MPVVGLRVRGRLWRKYTITSLSCSAFTYPKPWSRPIPHSLANMVSSTVNKLWRYCQCVWHPEKYLMRLQLQCKSLGSMRPSVRSLRFCSRNQLSGPARHVSVRLWTHVKTPMIQRIQSHWLGRQIHALFWDVEEPATTEIWHENLCILSKSPSPIILTAVGIS